MKLKRDANSFQNTNSAIATKPSTPNAIRLIAMLKYRSVCSARRCGQSRYNSAKGSAHHSATARSKSAPNAKIRIRFSGIAAAHSPLKISSPSRTAANSSTIVTTKRSSARLRGDAGNTLSRSELVCVDLAGNGITPGLEYLGRTTVAIGNAHHHRRAGKLQGQFL